MAMYNIYAGLDGGFGGARYVGTMDCKNIDEALKEAREMAVEEYQSYEGMYGLIGWSDIAENLNEYFLEEDASEEEINDVYIEEMEGWLDYKAVLKTEDTLDEKEYLL